MLNFLTNKSMNRKAYLGHCAVFVEKQIPELPDKKYSRFIKDYKLADYDAKVLTASIELAQFFETTAKMAPV